MEKLCIEYLVVYIKALKYLEPKERISADTSRKMGVMGAISTPVQTYTAGEKRQTTRKETVERHKVLVNCIPGINENNSR